MPVGADIPGPRLGNVVGDVGRERGFAHARPAGEDDQIGGLQAAHAGIQIGQSGRQPGQSAVALIGVRRHVDRGRERLREALKSGIVAAAFGDLVELALGFLDVVCRRRLDRRVVGRVDDLLADRDQVAADGEIVDGAPIILGIDDRRRFRGKPRQVLVEREAGDVELGRQERLQRDRGCDFPGSHQSAGEVEDALMDRFEEVLRCKEIGDAVEGLVIDQDGAEQRLFGFDIMRRRAERRFHGNLTRDRIDLGHGTDQEIRLWPICGQPPSMFLLCAHSTSRITHERGAAGHATQRGYPRQWSRQAPPRKRLDNPAPPRSAIPLRGFPRYAPAVRAKPWRSAFYLTDFSQSVIAFGYSPARRKGAA